jgi:hypothetical protein
MNIPTALKKITYPFIDAVLGRYGAWRAQEYDIENTILVSSTGRSGSTWLAEILVQLPRYHLIYEPFHLGSNPVVREHGLTWNNYIEPGTSAPKKKKYIRKVLDGRELSTRILNRRVINPIKLAGVQGYVVKTINANMILPWLSENYPIKLVWLIRHPCAVVASQLRVGGWSWRENKEAIYVPDQLVGRYPHIKKIYEDLSCSEENLAFIWAIQNYIPLTRDGEWVTTTYEKMVAEGRGEIERIFSRLGRSFPSAAGTQLRKESTSGSSFEFEQKDLLSSWRDRLSETQVQRILDVAHRVGVTCYTDRLHPDYGELSLVKS